MSRASMTTPGTYRMDDGSRVDFEEALATWTPIAYSALRDVAGHYRSTITYEELTDFVQDKSGIRTRMLIGNWSGKLLERVARQCADTNDSPLTSLCVHKDGTIGPGYARAPKSFDEDSDRDIEMMAAEHRLRCYQAYAVDLPADGGTPALTPEVAERRARARSTSQQPIASKLCTSCFTALPVSGRCDYCG